MLWLLAAVGGAAAGAAGGAAWLAYSAPVIQEGEMRTDEAVETDMPSGPAGAASLGVDAGAATAPDDMGEEPDGERSGDEPGPEEEDEVLPASPSIAPPRAPDPVAPTPFVPTENHQRLARIFAAMRPAEAASVLGQLDDGDARGVLMAMPARNAAPILAELEPDRAASLSRLVLRDGSP